MTGLAYPTFDAPAHQRRAVYFARVAHHAVRDLCLATGRFRRGWDRESLTGAARAVTWAVGRAMACAQGMEK